MSEPPDHPPTLDYSNEKPSMPIGVQAFMGAVLTLSVLALLCFASGCLSVGLTNGHGGVGVLLLIAVVVFGGTIASAVQLHKNPAKRGWAIGMFIGIGIGALLWGICGLFLSNINQI